MFVSVFVSVLVSVGVRVDNILRASSRSFTHLSISFLPPVKSIPNSIRLESLDCWRSFINDVYSVSVKVGDEGEDVKSDLA